MEEVIALLFSLPMHFRFEDIAVGEEQVIIKVRSTKQQAICPDCQMPTERVHSYYTRNPHDLPCGMYYVRLCLSVKRFRCINSDCERKTFAEQSPSFLQPHAQSTLRLKQLLTKITIEINGEAGNRICKALRIQTSPDTMIRCIRRTVLPVFKFPKVIGIDDWSMRKGHNYGTLIVDLEQRCPIDVLPERTAESVEQWLKAHPTVEIVCRDRYPNFIEGIQAGAPDATQIADRWHLLKNISALLQRVCSGFNQELQAVADQLADISAQTDEAAPAETKKTLSKRQKLFREVKKLVAEGYSNRTIAKMLPIHRSTVAKYRPLDVLPAIRSSKVHKAAAFEKYLVQRWQEGCHSPKALWLEIKEQGFTGSISSLWRFLHYLKMVDPDKTVRLRPKRLSPRQAAWLLVTPENQLNESKQQYKTALLTSYPYIAELATLSTQFIEMITEQKTEMFFSWIEKAKESDIRGLKRFAQKLEEDADAVHAALEYDWSNGQVEGQVNRLKTIKRLMYGRANFDLLRLRVLCQTGYP